MDAIESTGRAEIDHSEPTVVEHHDVARVGIGVEHAAMEDVVDVDPQQFAGERRPVDPIEGVDLGQRCAQQPFLHHDAPGAVLPEHLRDQDVAAVGDDDPHLVGVVGLFEEVELGPEAAPELVGEVGDLQVLAELGAPFRQAGQLVERRQVALHGVVDPRSLDLDHDGLAGHQDGGVRLSDRRGGQWSPFERCEDLFDRPTQLGFEDLSDVVGRNGRGPALEP